MSDFWFDETGLLMDEVGVIECVDCPCVECCIDTPCNLDFNSINGAGTHMGWHSDCAVDSGVSFTLESSTNNSTWTVRATGIVNQTSDVPLKSGNSDHNYFYTFAGYPRYWRVKACCDGECGSYSVVRDVNVGANGTPCS